MVNNAININTMKHHHLPQTGKRNATFDVENPIYDLRQTQICGGLNQWMTRPHHDPILMQEQLIKVQFPL